MKKLLPFIVITFVFLLVLGAIEIGHYYIVGWPINEKQWAPYVERRLNHAEVDLRFSDEMIFTDRKYIARSPSSFLCKWYIRDVGCIYRWSSLSKMIDNKFDSLLAISKAKKAKVQPEYAQ